jgi:hypothetical protein
MNEVSRTRIRKTVEEVVYVKERIKHFDREGSEYWAEVKVPDVVEKELDVIRIAYSCIECGESKVIEEEIKKTA